MNGKETTRRERNDGENTEGEKHAEEKTGEKTNEENTKTKTGNLGKIDLNSKSEVLFSDSLNSSIRWLTTNEAAEYLRTSPRQIRNWVYQGRIKAYKLLGKSLRFKVSELDLLFKGGLVWG